MVGGRTMVPCLLLVLLSCVAGGRDATPAPVAEQLAALQAQVAALTALVQAGTPSPPPPPRDRYDVKLDFGARGDGLADDTVPLQQGIDAARDAGTAVFIPRGTYRTTAPLQMGNGGYGINCALRVESDWATILATSLSSNASQPLPAPPAMESVVNITIGSHLTISRLLLDANNGTALYGLRGFKISGPQARISQVTVRGARSHGFLLEACQVSHWQHLLSADNGGDGLYLRGANGASFSSLTSMSNRGNGIHIEGMKWCVRQSVYHTAVIISNSLSLSPLASMTENNTHAAAKCHRNNTATTPPHTEVYSGGCWLSDFSSEVNALDGVRVGGDPLLAPDLTGSSVRDGWLEGNKGDGVDISAANTLVSGLRIVGGSGHGDRAVRVRATALGAVVHGVRTGGSPNYTDHYNTILVEADVALNRSFDVSQGNFNMYSVGPMGVQWVGGG